MVQFRPQAREIIAKVVYYGPPLGGKTTNLRTLYDGYPPNVRGEMLVVPAGGDRTIFFDFLPVDAGTLRGMRMRVQLYTVPGQVHYNATRQVVLRGVDAVVFVADSQRELLRANRESWENLKENLALQGLNLHDLPHVLQYNKRDLKELLSIGDLDQLLNEFNAPFYEAVASTGIGVEETLQGVVRLVARSLRDRFRLPPADEHPLFGPVAAGALDDLSAVFNGPPPAAAPPAAPPAAYTPPVPTFGVSSRDLSLGAPVPGVAPEPALAPASGLGAPIFRFAAPPDLPPAPHGFVTPPDEPADAPAAPPIPAAAVAEFTVFAENDLFGDGVAGPASGVTGKVLVGPTGTPAPADAALLSDPFEAASAAQAVAGADVFEISPPTVTLAAAEEAPVAAVQFEREAASAPVGPAITAALSGEAGQAIVQRIVPRALAQVGEVRELELEVPVPAVWTGGKRLTLQFRLTLIPEEDAHAE